MQLAVFAVTSTKEPYILTQKTPTYEQKSPTYPQKSPTYPQKKPTRDMLLALFVVIESFGPVYMVCAAGKHL